MKIIPRCGACEPDSDAAELMGDDLAATCAHCGSLVTRQRRWKPDGPGIQIGEHVFICTPPDEQATQGGALA